MKIPYWRCCAGVGIQAEAELLPGRVLHRRLLELRALVGLEELLDDLAGGDRGGFLLARVGVDRVVALGARAAAAGGEREEKQGDEGDASHLVKSTCPFRRKQYPRRL